MLAWRLTKGRRKGVKPRDGDTPPRLRSVCVRLTDRVKSKQPVVGPDGGAGAGAVDLHGEPVPPFAVDDSPREPAGRVPPPRVLAVPAALLRPRPVPAGDRPSCEAGGGALCAVTAAPTRTCSGGSTACPRGPPRPPARRSAGKRGRTGPASRSPSPCWWSRSGSPRRSQGTLERTRRCGDSSCTPRKPQGSGTAHPSSTRACHPGQRLSG